MPRQPRSVPASAVSVPEAPAPLTAPAAPSEPAPPAAVPEAVAPPVPEADAAAADPQSLLSSATPVPKRRKRAAKRGPDGEALAEEAPAPLTLEEIVERLPTEPGVYLMKDSEGKVIYVGKAKQLKVRVKQYFAVSGDSRPMVPFLIQQIAHIDTIIVPSEKEALLLENTLIKKHQP